MHQAPALAFEVARSRVHGYLLIALAGLGALTGAAWLHPFDAAGWRQALFLVTFLFFLVIATRQWLRWRAIHRDGGVRWIETTNAILPSKNGGPPELVSASRTDRQNSRFRFR